MWGRVSMGLMAAGLALAATPALACSTVCVTGDTRAYQEQAYVGGGYAAASGGSYSRTVQVQEYGADYASGYEARSDDGYAQGARYEERREDYYQGGGYRQAVYGPAPQPSCPQMGGERVVRCVYRPIYEEIRIDTGILDGGVGVIPSGGGGGGGGFVVVGGGMVSAGARATAFASASASASVSVRGGGSYGGGHRGGGCNCGGGKH